MGCKNWESISKLKNQKKKKRKKRKEKRATFKKSAASWTSFIYYGCVHTGQEQLGLVHTGQEEHKQAQLQGFFIF
jgi:hypothetical protein